MAENEPAGTRFRGGNTFRAPSFSSIGTISALDGGAPSESSSAPPAQANLRGLPAFRTITSNPGTTDPSGPQGLSRGEMTPSQNLASDMSAIGFSDNVDSVDGQVATSLIGKAFPVIGPLGLIGKAIASDARSNIESITGLTADSVISETDRMAPLVAQHADIDLIGRNNRATMFSDSFSSISDNVDHANEAAINSITSVADNEAVDAAFSDVTSVPLAPQHTDTVPLAPQKAEAFPLALQKSKSAAVSGVSSGSSGGVGPAGGAPAGGQAAPGVGGKGGGSSSVAATGGSGTGGSKIICLELHDQELLDSDVFTADEAFGDLLPKFLLDGYHLWARPVVRGMRRSRAFSRFMARLARPVARAAACLMGEGRGSVIGFPVLFVGAAICAVLGAAIAGARLARTVFRLNF